MTVYLKNALCAFAFTCAVPAAAATVTYTDNSASPNVARFDPALGTLESVSFRNTYNNAIYLNYVGNPDAPTAPTINVTGTIGDPILGQVAINQIVQTMFEADRRIISFRLQNIVEALFTTNLSAYVGRGNLTVAPFDNLTTGGYSRAVVSFPNPFSQASVTYTFTPAIPEPSTWALMLAGFGMVGYAMRRRRQSVAFA